MKKSVNLQRFAFGSVLLSAVFSMFSNEALVFAGTNPAGAGLGSNPTGSGRLVGEDEQSKAVNGIVNSGSSYSTDSKGVLEFGAGFLALDSVPDLHFMPTFAGSRNSTLMNNTRGGYVGTDFADGNAYGKLQVSDYRFSGQPYDPATSKPLNGWTLSAQLGYFSPAGGSGAHTDPNYNDSGAAAYGGTAPSTPPTTVGANDWAIFLDNKKAAVDRNTAHSANFRNNVTLSAAPMYQYPKGSDVNYNDTSTLIAGGPQVKIWWTPKSSSTPAAYGGFGRTAAYYDSSTTAALKVGNKATDGNYYAPITWTLMAGSN
ncbi:hypothetical protein [Xylocopilactobacillus apicola]|uniref:WxL domain-containing protein n=1 Tax=Xylocopilactobacillus apicola TaxID=2932184 RepID=A0AAU9DDC0_9LACO|nr:hypothetical protein [Xylocopilactobacillus apicola]BDR59575.1 hypothetical protein XA3_20160 [Xylocopilactobacillus apicola]